MKLINNRFVLFFKLVLPNVKATIYRWLHYSQNYEINQGAQFNLSLGYMFRCNLIIDIDP